MTKKQKIAIGAGGLIIAAIIGYILYRRRWQKFNSIGNSQWLPTDYSDGRLALRMDSEKHGIKPGDKVEIDHVNVQTPQGGAKVLDVVQKREEIGLSTYVVTELPALYNQEGGAGKVRIIG